MRWISGGALVAVAGWSLACMVPMAHDHDHDDETLIEPEEERAPPDGTTLWGRWVGEVACPSADGTIQLDLAHSGSWFAGPAVVVLGDDTLEFDVDIDWDGVDQTYRALVIETPGCEDCPVFDDVVWDLEILPAVIDGDLVDLVPDEVCAFSLQATWSS